MENTNNREKVAAGGVSITERKAWTFVFIKMSSFAVAVFCFLHLFTEFKIIPYRFLPNFKCVVRDLLF